MNYLFKYHGREMNVDATPRGLFGWWQIKRFFIGMYIAGWSWELKELDTKE